MSILAALEGIATAVNALTPSVDAGIPFRRHPPEARASMLTSGAAAPHACGCCGRSPKWAWDLRLTSRAAWGACDFSNRSSSRQVSPNPATAAARGRLALTLQPQQLEAGEEGDVVTVSVS